MNPGLGSLESHCSPLPDSRHGLRRPADDSAAETVPGRGPGKRKDAVGPRGRANVKRAEMKTDWKGGPRSR